ncbi:hypothetical protein SASPL_118436 [Salvia splendens]|uniref:Pentatricopeptide repeat-containing protein n=1 Tax=Salvia splendens TaxID=180675 RepID=A0A8X8ZX83_SALSN|nr:hypothetical protein SASPL_118436 [Salvia splendens]
MGISADAFAVLILGYWRLKNAERAVDAFGRMKDYDCKPNLFACNVILHVLVKENVILLALAVYNMMIKLNVDMRCDTFNVLIDGLCKNGMTEADPNLFEEMTSRGISPNKITYTVVISGLCKIKRTSDAYNLFNEMGFCCLIDGLVKANRFSEAEGFSDLGLLDDAESLKLEISQNNQLPNMCTYTILIRAFCRNGVLVEAQQIFNNMQKLGCSPSVVTFNALIDGLCKAGKLEEAQLMLYKMEVEDMMEFGSVLKAYKLLKKLAASGVVPNVQKYNSLIYGMCSAGHINIALKLLEELQLKGLSPDSVTYATLIYALQKVDRDGDAYKLFEQTNANGCKPSSSVYKTFMSWSSRKRQTSVTSSFWLKYLKNRAGVKDEVLQSIEECFEKGEFEQAVRYLLEMDIKLADFDSTIYDIWLTGLCLTKQADEAQKAFYALEEFNVPVSPPSCVLRGYRLRPRVCNSLVGALLKSKDKVIVALELLDRMKSAGYDLNCHLYPRTKSLLPHIYSLQKVDNASELRPDYPQLGTQGSLGCKTPPVKGNTGGPLNRQKSIGGRPVENSFSSAASSTQGMDFKEWCESSAPDL